MPRLSIVIPTIGNRADLLDRAIQSALAQTSSDIEIVVSDNASTDEETQSVIARHAPRGLRIFRHSSRMSAGEHGQFLLEQAKGEYFLSLSDDDYIEPDLAAEVLAAYDGNPLAGFIYTGCAIHYENIQVPCAVGPQSESGAEFLLNHYSGHREVCWCACVVRKRELLELGPLPDDRILGDMYFWTKLAFRGPVICVPRVLSHYILLRPQLQNDNISHGTSPFIWTRESWWIVEEVLETARNAGASEEYLSGLKYEARRHVARSAANQFIWTRIRGAQLSNALRWAIKCLPYFVFTWPVVSRLGAALLLPPKTLRNMLLRSASRLSESRNAQKVLDA
jgi:hypothetical protein